MNRDKKRRDTRIKDTPLSIKENMIWNSLGSFIYLFTQWLLTILVARILGFEDAGVFSLAMSLTNTFYCIALYGMRNYQVSDMNLKYSDKVYIVSRIYTSIVACTICFLIVIINQYSWYQKMCISTYMIFKISESWVDVYHGIFQKNYRLDIVGKSFLYRGVMTLVTFSISMLITRSLLISIIVMTLSTYLVIILYDNKLLLSFINIRGSIESTDIKNLLVECLPLAAYLFLSIATSTIPRFFLEEILGSEMLGIYASIATPVLIIQTVATYIFTPLIVLFAQYVIDDNTKQFSRLFIRVITTIGGISLISIIGAKIFGELGLKILFGDIIVQYVYILLPIIWCTILTATAWFISAVLTVLRDFKGLILSSSMGVCICIAFSSTSIKRWGLNGTSYIFIVCLVIQIAIMCTCSRLRIMIMKGERNGAR